jgi:hypothetical protein
MAATPLEKPYSLVFAVRAIIEEHDHQHHRGGQEPNVMSRRLRGYNLTRSYRLPYFLGK